MDTIKSLKVFFLLRIPMLQFATHCYAFMHLDSLLLTQQIYLNRVSCIILTMYGQWSSSERWATTSLLFIENIQMPLCGFIIYCYQKGCSTPGVYGGQCNKPCPENCQERRCDSINGTCLGCTPGWMGDSCTTGKIYIIPINFLTW